MRAKNRRTITVAKGGRVNAERKLSVMRRHATGIRCVGQGLVRQARTQERRCAVNWEWPARLGLGEEGGDGGAGD